MTWNPDRYHQFAEARAKPAHDLLAMLEGIEFAHISDLGCGTGEGTLELARRFPYADVLGVDSSAEMLARVPANRPPNVRFQQGDIRKLAGTYDLIISNAALQWLPDHPALLTHLWARQAAGGLLAVQVPANHDHASHRLMTDTARAFAAELGGYARFGTAHDRLPVLTPEAYAEVLHGLGAENINVQARIYPVVLESVAGLLDWVRGTALVPYLSRLSPEDSARFEAAYLARLHETFGGGEVFYAFKRVLFTARKPA